MFDSENFEELAHKWMKACIRILKYFLSLKRFISSQIIKHVRGYFLISILTKESCIKASWLNFNVCKSYKWLANGKDIYRLQCCTYFSHESMTFAYNKSHIFMRKVWLCFQMEGLFWKRN